MGKSLCLRLKCHQIYFGHLLDTDSAQSQKPLFYWRALRESNPCFRRERPASWTARRRALRQIEARRIISFKRGGKPRGVYHLPVFGIDFHGSCGGRAEPFCKSSIECLSGERTNAMLPSRGGR